MACFTDTPLDILLKVLYLLEVDDILCLERTCTYLRDIISTRHLWLVKLEGLDQACAPALPPHNNIDELSYFDLRGAVVRAVRVYLSLAKDDFCSAAYELQANVPIVRPAVSSQVSWAINEIRLSPGGRYLFLIWKGSGTRESNVAPMELQVIDIDRASAKRNVWSYRFKHIGGLPHCYVRFTFEICRDGSIMLALCESGLKGIDYKSYFKLFRLSVNDTPAADLQAELINVVDLNPNKGYEIALSGRFVTLYTHDTSVLMVMDWKMNRKAELHMNDKALHNLKIYRGHLFYVESTTRISTNIFRSICALSIEEALSIAETNSVEFEIGSNYTAISRLQLGVLADEELLEARDLQYLIHSRKRDPPQVIFSIIGADSFWDSRRGTRFGSYYATFDPRELAISKWALLKSEQLVGCPADSRLYLTTEVSLSGRVLVEKIFSTYSMVVLDRDGLLHFTRIESIAQKRSWELPLFLDEFSEALLLERENAIEFYYPRLVTKIPDDGA